MSTDILIQVCAIIGIGLITASFVILQVFREPIKKYSKKATEDLINSESFKQLLKIKTTEKMDFEVIKNVYDDVSKIEKATSSMKTAFISCFLSGLFFILFAILINFNFPSPYEGFPTAFFAYGILSLLLLVYYLFSILKYIGFA